jgi:hypothetical protein
LNRGVPQQNPRTDAVADQRVISSLSTNERLAEMAGAIVSTGAQAPVTEC